VQDLSNTAFWLALAAAAAAVLLYWGYAFGARVVLRRLAAPTGRGFTVATVERLPDSFGRLGTLAAWTAAAFLAVSLFARWRAVGHAPWSNMWEFTVAFAAGICLCYVLFERWYGQRPDGQASARTLGSFVLPLVLGLMAVAAAFFPDDVRPLVPALQNQDLLAAHVAMMVLAYSALSVSFGAAAIYLVQGGNRQRFLRLPAARLLDEIAYRSVIVGFPLLTLGVVLGAYWGNSAWGRYWGWDPKETSALMTWLIYAGYLHMRGLRGWSGGRSAVLLVVGFASVLFTYFAVNLWVSGLHSYAGV
jgi:cytochrome c-type biogenesis protein CcsB